MGLVITTALVELVLDIPILCLLLLSLNILHIIVQFSTLASRWECEIYDKNQNQKQMKLIL